jgi:hypothetical protein
MTNGLPHEVVAALRGLDQDERDFWAAQQRRTDSRAWLEQMVKTHLREAVKVRLGGTEWELDPQAGKGGEFKGVVTSKQAMGPRVVDLGD